MRSDVIGDFHDPYGAVLGFADMDARVACRLPRTSCRILGSATSIGSAVDEYPTAPALKRPIEFFAKC
jgi:hypothetical protein